MLKCVQTISQNRRDVLSVVIAFLMLLVGHNIVIR